MTETHFFGRVALLALASIFFAGAALAQASVSLGVKDHDNSTPVEITSETLELDQDSGLVTFNTNVFVRQGDMTMTCDRMVVEYVTNELTGEDEIDLIRMFDKVTFTSPTEAAESDWAIYFVRTDIIEMYDNVLVTQGTTALSSDKLVYDLDTGEGLMIGNVKTILQQASN